MLKHELRHDEGILVLEPDGLLETADFETLTSRVDAYLENNGILREVRILAKRFPTWKDFEDFGALVAHLRFFKQHHQTIEKIAVVADGGFATIKPHTVRHFIHTQVKHFEPVEGSAARGTA